MSDLIQSELSNMSSNSNKDSIDSHINGNDDTHHRMDNTFVGQTIDINGHNLSVESVITEGSSQSSFSTSVELNDLPEELLTIILDSLDFQSTLLAERVCKRWQQLINGLFDNTRVLYIKDDIKIQYFEPFGIKDYNNIQYISLKQFSKCGHESRTLISKIISVFSQLKAIYLSLTDMNCTEDILSLICNNCDSDLTHISLMFNGLEFSLSFTEVLLICNKFPNLQILQISAIDLTISKNCLKVIIEKLPKLEVLILDGVGAYDQNKWLNKPITGKFYSKISPNITRIELPGYMLSDSAVINLAKQELPKFNTLVIPYLFFNNINIIKLICDRFQTLTSIECGIYDTLNKYGGTIFMNSVSKLSKLLHLKVSIDSDYDERPDFSYHSFTCFKYNQSIISLEISSSSLTSDCVLAISRFMPQLIELKLICIQFLGNSDECVQPIKHMNQLKRLTLSSDPELTDGSLTEIIDFCTNLEFLDISRCHDITEITILSAINRVMKTPNKTFTLCVNSRFRDFEKTVIEKLGKNILKFL